MRWYDGDEPLLIRHAGGEIEGYIYTNSKEAILKALQSGAKVIEVDVCFTSDGVPVLAHDFSPDGKVAVPTHAEFMASKINNRYTPMDLRQLIDLQKSTSAYFFLDPKAGDGARVATYIAKHFSDCDYQRIILQLSSLEDLYAVAHLGKFPFLHYNTAFPNLLTSMPTLVAYGVRTVSVYDGLIRGPETLTKLRENGIHVFTWTVNDRRRYNRLREDGVRGVFTDFLTEADLAPEK